MSGNTSASGGPLAPVSGGPAPIEGAALGDFIQAWIVGVTGMAGTLVRPRWPVEVPNLPAAATCWCSYGITARSVPQSPFIEHDGAANGGLGQDSFSRQEELDVMLTWYDLGDTGRADFYDGIFADGVTIGQNLEVLAAGGFGFAEIQEATTIPVLVKERWQYRIDRRFKLRRIVNRAYPVQNVVKAVGTITTDGGLVVSFKSNP